jgi:hypothetical protein
MNGPCTVCIDKEEKYFREIIVQTFHKMRPLWKSMDLCDIYISMYMNI